MFGKKKATLIESRRSVQVAGTSYRQKALRKIAGKKTEDGFDLPVTAALVPEPSNEHDRNAVSVQIDGALVGYLPRDLAAEAQPDLIEFRKRTRRHVAVNGRIVGGWKRGRKDEGDYGVRVYFDVTALNQT